MQRFSLFSLVAIIFVGCSNLYDEKYCQIETISHPVLTASFAEDTRTSIDGSNIIYWRENEAISVFVGNTKNVPYIFNGKTGDTSGVFYPTTQDDNVGYPLDRIYAISYYDDLATISEDGIINYILHGGGNYEENSFCFGANTMVAVTKDTSDTSLSFKNVCGYLKIKLYGDATVESVEIRGNNGEKIAGAATITAAYGSSPTVTMTEDATEIITINCHEGVALSADAEKPTEFWFVVPPMTFEKGITVVVVDSEGGVFMKRTDKPITINRNEILPMAKVNFNEDFVSLLDVERDALIAIYDALSGDDWPDNTNWCSNRPVNEWAGVYTDHCGRVRGIHVYYSSTVELNGSIPRDIENLRYLRELILRNALIKSVPVEITSLPLRRLEITASEVPLDEILKMDSLEHLDLNLTTMDLKGYELDISALTNLRTLDMIVNEQDLVKLPKSYSGLDNLSSLRMYGFAGTIDASIGDCSNLIAITISSGRVSGSIPSSICNLSELLELDLSKNELDGPIPAEIGNLIKLGVFNLSHNNLEGDVPASLIDLFDCDINWQFQGLHHNKLSGGITEDMQNHRYWSRIWPYIILYNSLNRNDYRLPGPRLSGYDAYGNNVDSEVEYASAEYTLIWSIPYSLAANPIYTFNYYQMKELFDKFEGINILQIGERADTDSDARSFGAAYDIPWKLFALNIWSSLYPLIVEDGFGDVRITAGSLIGNQVNVVDRSGNMVFVSLVDGYYDELFTFLEQNLGLKEGE